MASQSRRQFLRYSTGTAALVLTEGCASRPPTTPAPVTLRGATLTTTTHGGADTERVIKPTPSRYFTMRKEGSQEMNWGPVKDYGDTVPNERFYVHNRARPPSVDLRTWRLEIAGDGVGRPMSLTFEQLLALPQVTMRRTLDCGANCRAFFPSLPSKATGWLPMGFTQWHFGAVGAAEWTGVRLKDILDMAGLLGNSVDVMFTGLDSIPTGEGKNEPYAQVIAIDKVLAADTLLVHRMNGAPLPVDHGYPVRAIFSGWGGNTAVKWVGRIDVAKQKLAQPTFQARQLIYGPDIPRPFTPTTGPIRSALELNADMTLTPGNLTLRGRAWSGAGAIERVDVSIERLVAPNMWRPLWTPAWREAQLIGKPEPLFWTRFEIPWMGVEPGRYRLMTRARDGAGNVQPRPEDVPWNQIGLGNNGHAPLELAVLPMAIMP
jgi:DMSO/TMAO reductase YedYZ molybdopterin-dependent catalytic subunit